MGKIKSTVIGLLIIVNTVVAGNHPNCSVDIEDIIFGTYDPFDKHIKRTYTTLTVRCSHGMHKSGASFSISVVGGNSSNPQTRYLYSPSKNEKLYYNLYYRNCVLGDGTGGTCKINVNIPPKKNCYSEVQYIIVGVIPPMQNVSAAHDYQDNLTVIIEY
ncbi:spore coat protein U domain-containing protein [Persephonella sp.]|uniref:spore coat protein U domain-containing protein n=1 Tax=Persephonella sp. TaxID=2060922 RepID=UPI0025F372B1|nr:spore coat protein U domain-containing protein [Persephonella sp.]